jgi:hypothetical protein
VAEGDDEAGDMEKGSIDVGVVFVSNNEAPKISQPGEGSFNFPTVAIAPEFAAILKFVAARGAMWTDQINASGLESCPEFVAVVTAIGN